MDQAMQTSSPSPQIPVALAGAVQFDMVSAISGRTYRIFVFQPGAPPPPAGYPVVVVTDANLNFPIAATMDAAFGLQGGASALVIGVGYAADDMFSPMFLRNRDLTPPTPLAAIPSMPILPPPLEENYGGSDDFFHFLTEELRPAIAAGYSVDAGDQTLFGHSLGGLFTLEVLFKHPGSFRNFVASSPSIWWNDRSVLADEAPFAADVEAGEASPRVLIMAGADEQLVPAVPPPHMTHEQATMLVTAARMVDNARELADRLSKLNGSGDWTIRFHAFDGEDHMTVVPAAVTRALTFALRP